MPAQEEMDDAVSSAYTHQIGDISRVHHPPLGEGMSNRSTVSKNKNVLTTMPGFFQANGSKLDVATLRPHT